MSLWQTTDDENVFQRSAVSRQRSYLRRIATSKTDSPHDGNDSPPTQGRLSLASATAKVSGLNGEYSG
jgi:hypothetical protein